MATSSASNELSAEIVVLGGGPGGYTAAFRAADLGKKVILIERYPVIGGVCLNVGCIPSKALLHIAKVVQEAEELAEHGVSFGKPAIDLDKVRAWKISVTRTLNDGLAGLIKQRKITLVQGVGKFTSANTLSVNSGEGGETTVKFDQAIIAVGSHPTKNPFFSLRRPAIDGLDRCLGTEEYS